MSWFTFHIIEQYSFSKTQWAFFFSPEEDCWSYIQAKDVVLRDVFNLIFFIGRKSKEYLVNHKRLCKNLSGLCP